MRSNPPGQGKRGPPGQAKLFQEGFTAGRFGRTSVSISHLLVRADVPSGWPQQGDQTLEEQVELWVENQRKRCRNDIFNPLFSIWILPQVPQCPMNPLCNTTKATGGREGEVGPAQVLRKVSKVLLSYPFFENLACGFYVCSSVLSF